MRSLGAVSSSLAACGLMALAFGQQGRQQQENYVRQVQDIENRMSSYLNGDEIRNILTPGEYSEWPMDLKAGQVLIADARSDAFDPALEMVDAGGKVLASNDDRYPGDQRPLLFWRCEKDGSYKLRARCFQNKSGGLFFLRFKTYDSIDLSSGQMVEKTFDKPTEFLLRVPMKAGQIKQIVTENPDGQRYATPQGIEVISPIGLPDIHLDQRTGIVQAIRDTIVAPVAGDYYCLESDNDGGQKTVRVGTREIVPAKPEREGATYVSTPPGGSPTLMAIAVKAGDVFEETAPDLPLGSPLVIAEQPDFATYALDPDKPEMNPFFPKKKGSVLDKASPFAILPGRSRDSRVLVFVVHRDADLWLATNGAGGKNGRLTLTVRPAARDYPDGKTLGNRLGIGYYDYWAFDAKLGDVMTFNCKATTFAQRVMLSNADVDGWMCDGTAAPDQTSMDWKMVARKPGRYLVAVSAMGDGGGGEYTLSRQVFHAKEFTKATPAKGELRVGDTQVWKFTAKPDEPLLVHWKASNSGYSVLVRDENGADAGLPLTGVDGTNQYGILKVDKPTTFLIVLSADPAPTSYSIELGDIPGYVKGK